MVRYLSFQYFLSSKDYTQETCNKCLLLQCRFSFVVDYWFKTRYFIYKWSCYYTKRFTSRYPFDNFPIITFFNFFNYPPSCELDKTHCRDFKNQKYWMLEDTCSFYCDFHFGPNEFSQKMGQPKQPFNYQPHKPQFWESLALNWCTFWKEIALCGGYSIWMVWWKYTPQYEKARKKIKNGTMETTLFCIDQVVVIRSF